MKKKRILMGTLVFLLVTIIFSTTASAQEIGTLDVGFKYCKPGDEVTIPIAIFDNPGIISLGLEVEYDDKNLSLQRVIDGNYLPGAYHSDKFSSPYRLLWEDFLSKTNYTGDGLVAQLVFKVSETASTGSYFINLSTVRDGALNSNLDNVPFTCYSGYIYVEADHVHSWSANWTNSGGGGHSRYCDCGEHETESHKWDIGVITTPVTQNTVGIKKYTCIVCDANKYEKFYDEKEINNTPIVPDEPTTPSTPTTPPYTCPYTDISNHWANDIIQYIDKLGLIDGMTAKTFAPDKPMTREVFVISVARLAGVKNNYINWAIENEILKGYGNGEYGLKDTVTREQMAVFFLRFLEYMNINYDAYRTVAHYDFADDAKIADWAEDAVYEMQALDLIHGKGNGIFDPQGLTTRAEGAAVLYNMCKAILNK